MKKTTQISAQIKKQVKHLMGKDIVSFNKKITRNDKLYLESQIVVSYESTCRIGIMVDYKLTAFFNKENNKVTFIQH
jgi:hypothetical protein